MISSQIIKHSTSWLGQDMITFVLTYPRYIHSELMTHRVFSKNSASSRAVPIDKFKKDVMNDPVKPIWTLNQPGMQGKLVSDNEKVLEANNIWLDARNSTLDYVDELHKLGMHKQNINRLLEPWFHMKIILTGTDFDNWFTLRDHPDAQPEIQELARQMKWCLERSEPEHLNVGEWHIPFGDKVPQDIGILDKLRISVARCARVSYNNFDGSTDIQKDIELFEKLIVQEPLHASPSEHQGRVPSAKEMGAFNTSWIPQGMIAGWPTEDNKFKLSKGKYVSNLTGWIQLRKVIEAGEFNDDYIRTTRGRR